MAVQSGAFWCILGTVRKWVVLKCQARSDDRPHPRRQPVTRTTTRTFTACQVLPAIPPGNPMTCQSPEPYHTLRVLSSTRRRAERGGSRPSRSLSSPSRPTASAEADNNSLNVRQGRCLSPRSCRAPSIIADEGALSSVTRRTARPYRTASTVQLPARMYARAALSG